MNQFMDLNKSELQEINGGVAWAAAAKAVATVAVKAVVVGGAAVGGVAVGVAVVAGAWYVLDKINGK